MEILKMEMLFSNYWFILAVGSILSLVTSIMVKIAFKHGQKIQLCSNLSGAEVAQYIVEKYALDGVTVERGKGFLVDHYNPINKKLVLSPDVYDGKTAAAVGVAAHEAGHAIQHARGYLPLWFRSLLVPVASIGNRFSVFLIMIGLLLWTSSSVESSVKMAEMIIFVGVVFFASAVLFSVVTVPVEFNASKRAKVILQEEGILQTSEEKESVRRILFAAGLTYVAAAITAILQLIYWISRIKKR